MKKLSFLLAFALLVIFALASCGTTKIPVAVAPDVDYPPKFPEMEGITPLTEAQITEIEQAFREEYGYDMKWFNWDDPVTRHFGYVYLGTMDGYTLLFSLGGGYGDPKRGNTRRDRAAGKGVVMMKNTNRSDWFYEAGFGLFVHWTAYSLPEKGEKKDYFRAVEDFDMDTFVGQVVDSGAKFLFFTTSHADMKLPFPLPELDAILPGHTASRDLIGELADRLEPHGIRLMLYFNGEGSTTPEWQALTGFRTDPATHAEYCYRVTEAISRKYGKKIHGWWIDCCYEPPICGGRGTRYDFKRYADCLRAGNPDSLVTFNFRGTEDWGCEWGRNIIDFQAGEENDIGPLPDGRFSGESGAEWFALCWMDDYWVHEKEGVPTPRYDNETVKSYIRDIRARGGVFAYNTAPYQEGHISAPAYAQLKWLGEQKD